MCNANFLGYRGCAALLRFGRFCRNDQLIPIQPVYALMVISKAFTPEHDMNSPVTVMNASLHNLFHSHDQRRVVACIGFLQIHNPAELDHGTSHPYAGTKPLHKVGGQLTLA